MVDMLIKPNQTKSIGVYNVHDRFLSSVGCLPFVGNSEFKTRGIVHWDSILLLLAHPKSVGGSTQKTATNKSPL